MSKPREYIGINPGGNSNALINVLIPDDFNALRFMKDHPYKIELIEKSAYDLLKAENENLRVILQEMFAEAGSHEGGKFICFPRETLSKAHAALKNGNKK